jgi:hypothetical protein
VADHDTPAAAAPQPQAQVQQQPVLQQQPVGQPQLPVLLPQQPIVVPPQLLPAQPVQAAPLPPQQAVQPAIPNIVITPPPPQCTPQVQKRRLEAIPEEDSATGSRCPKIEAEDVSPTQGASGGGLSPTMEQLGQRGREDSDSDSDERLRDVFRKLNLTPEHELLIASPASSEDEFPVFKTAPSTPSTPKPAPPSPKGAQAGPPSQRTRQMEKDFANTQYKRSLEAEALEKKKKKELAREKEEKIKQEKEFAKSVYCRSLEAEKKVKKEIKKEK